MPRKIGQDREETERRIAEETEDGRRRFIQNELELLSLILTQIGNRWDHPPEILENANEIVERLRKINQEV